MRGGASRLDGAGEAAGIGLASNDADGTPHRSRAEERILRATQHLNALHIVQTRVGIAHLHGGGVSSSLRHLVDVDLNQGATDLRGDSAEEKVPVADAAIEGRESGNQPLVVREVIDAQSLDL